MAKSVPLDERLTAPVITHLPLKVRAQVELLAHRERTSLAEIARRAVVQYLERSDATHAKTGRKA